METSKFRILSDLFSVGLFRQAPCSAEIGSAELRGDHLQARRDETGDDDERKDGEHQAGERSESVVREGHWSSP